MVDDEIKKDFHASSMCLVNESLNIVHRSVRAIYILIIGDVISHIHLRALIMRTDMDHVDSDIVQVVELRNDAGDVTNPVAVGVLKGSGVDFVDYGFFPPFMLIFIVIHAGGQNLLVDSTEIWEISLHQNEASRQKYDQSE